VFLLTRTNRQAAKLAWGLRQGGVPYLDLKPNGPLRRWDHPAPALLAALRSFDEDDSLPVPVAEILLRNATDAPARREPKRLAERDRLSGTDPAYGRQVLADEYNDWFPNADSGRELVGELTVEDWRRELIAGALESDASHAPDEVRVGTIHAAKGLEAPCVLVFPAYTHRQLERFQDGAGAEERRRDARPGGLEPVDHRPPERPLSGHDQKLQFPRTLRTHGPIVRALRVEDCPLGAAECGDIGRRWRQFV